MMLKPNSNEIKIVRTYNAPIKAVWVAWTDEKQAAHWWGPRGFTITNHNKDFRVGGIWHYTMHGPDGVDYPNKTTYLEIKPLSHMVYDHGGYDDRPPMFRVTVQFTEVGSRTKMNMIMALPTPEAAKEAFSFIKKAGGNATWDRLAEYLEKTSAKKEIFVINRSFQMPIESMFEMWISPKHLTQWAGPAGAVMKLIRSEIQPGGVTFYEMTGPDGTKMFGLTKYLEIQKPTRIVYTQQFCDKDEKTSRHPMAKTWPETMRTIVEFDSEGPENTKVTLTWEPEGPVTPEELATFVHARAGMTMGWTGSFDNLEAYHVKL